MRIPPSRSIALVIASTLVLAACGTSDEASRRSLNSVACFESVEAKEAARLQAQTDYEQTIPTTTLPLLTLNSPELTEASGVPSFVQSAEGESSDLAGSGYRMPAIARPQADETTTTSSAPSTTSTTIAQSTSTSVISSSTSTSTTLSSGDQEDSDESTTTVVDGVTTTSVDGVDSTTTVAPAPQVSQDQGQAAMSVLQTVMNTPLCSEIDSLTDGPTTSEVSDSSEPEARECEISAEFNPDGTALIDLCEAATWFSATGSSVTMSFAWLDTPLTVSAFNQPFTLTVWIGGVIVFAQEITPGQPVSTSSTYYVTSDAANVEVPVTVAQPITSGDECYIDTRENRLYINCGQFVTAYLTITIPELGEGSRTMVGVSNSVFDLTGVASMSIRAWTLDNVIVIDQEIQRDTIYAFVVPNSESQAQSESGEDDSSPLYSGLLSPAVEKQVIYRAENPSPIFVELYASCDEQSISATLTSSSTQLTVDFQQMPPWVLNEGLCGTWLSIEDPMPAGDYVIDITTTTDEYVRWSASAPLLSENGPGSLDFYPLFDSTVLASTQLTFTTDSQVGGWLRIRGNSNVECGDGVVDPYLLLLDAEGRVLTTDDDTASFENNCKAALIVVYIKPNTGFSIVASTYDIAFAEALAEDNETRENPPNEYQLIVEWADVRDDNQLVIDNPPVGVEDSRGTQLDPASVGSLVEQAPSKGTAANPPLPTANLTSDDVSIDAPAIVVNADVNTMVCSKTCIDALFELTGITDGTVTVTSGSTETVVSRNDWRVEVPLSSGRQTITVVGTAVDGSNSETFSAPVVRMTPRFAGPPETGPVPIYPALSGPPGRIPLSLPWVLAVFAVLIIAGWVLNRRSATR